MTNYKSLLLAILLTVFAGCEKENEGKIEFDPEAVTQSAGNLEMFSATIYGKLVLPDIKQEEFTFGFEYSTDRSFGAMQSKKVQCAFYNTQNENRFSSSLKNLKMATEYYYRAYIIYKDKTYYGEIMSFTTKGVEVVTGDMDPSTFEVTSRVEMGADFEKIRYGLCFGITENLTTENSVIGTNEAQEDGSYTLKLNNIPYGEFFYRAYVNVNDVTYYGEVKRLEGNKVVTGELDMETMSVSGWVRYHSGYDNFSYGICYGTSSTPVYDRDRSVGGGKFDSEDNFTAVLTRIPFGKVYYRAYIVIDQKVYYGETYSFQHEMKIGQPVDLGLSVKWADMNLGADYPTDYGFYLGWGETEEKEGMSWANYKYCRPNPKYTEHYPSYSSDWLMTKYCLRTEYGDVDGKTVLEPADDAATVMWGDGWRMPTNEEFQELFRNCSYSFVIKDGVNGYSFTSNLNGNSIFLPAAGGQMLGEYQSVGSVCAYWTSELYDNADYAAIYYYMYSEGLYQDWWYRIYCYSVRAVFVE